MHDDSPWQPPADGTPPPPDRAAVPPPDRAAVPPPDRAAVPPPDPDPTSVLPPPPPADGVPTLGHAPVPPPPTWSPNSSDTVAAADDAYPPAVSEPGRPRRSKLLVGGGIIAAVAVAGAGIFALRGVTDSAAGGADTPTELGDQMLLALENEDVLGAIDLLVPGERDALGQPFIEMVGELQRLGVLADADLSKISGFDVTLEREDVQVRPTNVDDIVNIDLRAEATVTVDGAALPIGDLVTDNIPADARDEMESTQTTESDQLDVELTAVRDDGSWYFSLLHTAAEAARRDAAPGTDIPVSGVGAIGADSPEGVVDLLFDQVQQLDLTGLIQALDPDEAAALQRYAPLFLDEAQSSLDEIPIEWTITDRQVRVEGDGDERTAFVDGLTVDGTVDGDSFSVVYADGCVEATYGDESYEQCATIDGNAMADEIFADAPDVKALIDLLETSFADMEPAGLELRQTDGSWYVSPIGSVTEAVLKLMRALDQDELQAIIDAAPAAFDDVGDLFFGSFDMSGMPMIDDSLAADEGPLVGDETITDDMITDDMITDDPVTDDSFDGPTTDDSVDGSAEANSWDACYGQPDATSAMACFQPFIDSGEIGIEYVPVTLRFPECGLAESSWTGDLYSLEDAEFTAVLVAAQPCFQALVQNGTINEYEVPTEVNDVDCFEGRNWYSIFDDPDYDARVETCRDAAVGG